MQEGSRLHQQGPSCDGCNPFIPVSLHNLLMEKGNVKDYLKQGIILNDMIRNHDFFFFFLSSSAFQILKSGCFSCWQQGAADESQFWASFKDGTFQMENSLKWNLKKPSVDSDSPLYVCFRKEGCRRYNGFCIYIGHALYCTYSIVD